MNLQESIRRILREEITKSIKRRYTQIVRLLDVVMDNSYPCDYESLDHFVEGIFFDMSEYLYSEDIDGMDKFEIMEFVHGNLIDHIEKYYQDYIEFCSKNIKESTEIPKIVKSIQNSIDNNGFLITMKLFGYEEVISRLDLLGITLKEKLDFIKKVYYDEGISLHEIGEPIKYKETDDEYFEIAWLGSTHCYIDIWGKNSNGSFIDNKQPDELKMKYYNLNDEIIDQIFRITLMVALHNNID